MDAMALQKVHKGKRPRRESHNELCIEEMSPDDMGYDGDVEVLRPDQYEDAESDFEGDNARRHPWPDTDDELAGKLRRLSCDPHALQSQHSEDSTRAGLKRQCKEMEVDEPGRRRTEIEVSELVEEQPPQRPIKRRKGKVSKPQRVKQLVKRALSGTWSDSSEQTEDGEASVDKSPSGTPDVPSTPAAADRDADAMDTS